MYIFASKGEMGEPCRLPRRLSRASVVRVFLPRSSVSSTGHSSHILIRCSTRRSTIRRATDFRSSLADTIGWMLFQTGDAETDRLLEAARRRILSPKPEDRQDALEKLWDAFERLKTLEPGANKREQADALLDRVAAPGSAFRQAL